MIRYVDETHILLIMIFNIVDVLMCFFSSFFFFKDINETLLTFPQVQALSRKRIYVIEG